MSLIIFENQVDLVNQPLPPAGAFIVGYNSLNGKLSQKDSNGVITEIGSGIGNNGSLSQTLAIGNTTGTYSILLDNGSLIKSSISGAQIRLDNGTPQTGIVNISTDAGALSESYLFMNPTGLTLRSLNRSLIFNSNMASFQYDTNNIMTINSNQYFVSIGGFKVLEFTTATSSVIGNRISGIISSNGSTLSSGLVNTVIIGGVSQTATQSNSVYVPDVYIQNGKILKGTLGSSYLRFTNTNDGYLHGVNSHIGILSSTSSLSSSGISIRDTATNSTTADIDGGVTYISTRNSSAIAGLKNTIIIGGSSLNATYSNTTYIGGTVSINGKYNLPQGDGFNGQVLQTDGFGNLSWGSGDIPSITITSASFSSLSVFAKDMTYKILDADINLYGGTEIYLTTNSEGILNEKGVGKFYNPKYEKGIAGYGIWNSSNSYSIGSTVIWGGRVWTNMNGNVGSNVDAFMLSSPEWSVISYDSISYNISYDIIQYDRIYDRILYRNENNSNIVTYSNHSYVELGVNPIKVFQWGNLYNESLGNGIANQHIVNSYNENINFTGLYQTDIFMDGLSYQENLQFDNLSSQSLIILNNNSHQGNISFVNSSQTSIVLLNSSYQESMVLDNSNQLNIKFSNMSYQSTCDMVDSSQYNFSFENSNQVNLSINAFYQNSISLLGYSWDRTGDPVIDNEDGLNFVGGSMTTFTSNVKILGTSSIINSTNTTIADPIIVLAATQSGVPVLDSGFFINRGTGATQAFIWDESAKEFSLIETNDNHGTLGNVNINKYSNLRAYGITVSQIKITGSASNGYILTSDSNGLGYWSAPSSTGTPFLLTTDSSDAFGNKTASIYRTGSLLIGTVSVNSDDRFVVSTNSGKLNLIIDNTGDVYNDLSTNTRFGKYSLRGVSGTNSTAFGFNTLSGTSSGGNNAAFGFNILSNNSGGVYNIGMGSNVLYLNTIGNYNIGIGQETLYLNTGGNYNIGIGYRSLRGNTSGANNIFLGFNSMPLNSNGESCIGIGTYTLSNATSGRYVIAIGYGSLDSTTQSQYTVGIGDYTLRGSIGGYNTAIGSMAMQELITGSQNVAFGYRAGLSQSNGAGLSQSNKSILIGSETKTLSNNSINEIVIGDSAVGYGSNTVVIGNDQIVKTVLKGNVGIGTSSTATASLTISGGNNYVLPATASYSGEIVFFGTGTGFTAGSVYYFSNSGTWNAVSGTNSTIASSLLGIALGSNISQGILLKGYANFNVSHFNSMNLSNKQYLSMSAGIFTETPPSTPGQVSRLIGYCVSPNTIYFCPDNTWLEIT